MRTMPSTPSTSTLLRSTLLRGATIAVALTLPGQARAGWGDENWGTLLWDLPVPVPGLEWFGLLVLALALSATAAWAVARTSRPFLFGIAAIGALTFQGVALAGNFVVSNPPPVCSSAQAIKWSNVNTHSLGVAAIDPVGHVIGCSATRGEVRSGRPDGPSYVIFSPSKQTVCGRLDDYFFYDAFGDEADWNHNLIPTPHYAFFHDWPASLGIEVHEPSSGGESLIQAEITPDESYYSNPWFPKGQPSCDPARGCTRCLPFETTECSENIGFGCNGLFDARQTCNELSPLEGRTVCTYGPWVGDQGHGGRPEIHPAELTWWLSGNSKYLLMVQDDSNRFDRPEHFKFFAPQGCPPPPPEWRPWSAWPRTGKFKLAFSLSPTGTTAAFDVFVEHALEPDFFFGNDDVTPGNVHTLVLDGHELLRVTEKNQDFLTKVGFEDVCFLPATGKLVGFATLTVRAGSGDVGLEGLLLLRVDVTGQSGDAVLPPGPPPFLHPAVATQARFQKSSIVSVVDPGSARRLVADVQVQLHPAPFATAEDLIVLSVDVSERGVLRSAPFIQVSADTVSIEDVDATGGSEIIVTTAAGEQLHATAAPLGLIPSFSEQVLEVVPAAAAWPSFVSAAGALAGGTQPRADLVRVREWALNVAPSYVPLKEGSPAPEDGSPIGKELETIFDSGELDRINEIWGTTTPFALEWTFAARNLSTDGVEIPVVDPADPSAAPLPNAVLISFDPSTIPNAALRVALPDGTGDDILEITATATLFDTLGVASFAQSHTIYSHHMVGLDAAAVDRLLENSAELAGLPPEALVETSRLDLPFEQLAKNAEKEALRSATMTRLFTIGALQDGRITPQELSGMIGGAGLFVAPCGDGEVDPGEACDDGNLVGGDGCAADCSIIDGPVPVPTTWNPLGAFMLIAVLMLGSAYALMRTRSRSSPRGTR